MVKTLKEIESLTKQSDALTRKIAARWVAFGREVRTTRRESRMTLAELGAKSGIDQSLVSYLETGHRTVNMDTALKIVEALCE
jgi:DNA-binding XRE family transcriptional regulator